MRPENSHNTNDEISAQLVPISEVIARDDLRLGGEDTTHTLHLMSVADSFPPIIVHHETMRVIDGSYRLRALQALGRKVVAATFYHGDEESAFIAAVRINTRHGRPLSVAERRAAATRIVDSHSDWSDRRIAAVAGLAARTVAEIRRAKGSDGGVRVGRDNRLRPVDASAGRRLAGQLFAEQPNASLREIARLAGISPETARDVRFRLAHGEDPAPDSKQEGGTREDESAHKPAPQLRITPALGRFVSTPLSPGEQLAIIAALRKDPSVRFTEGGRLLLRWLEVSQAAARESDLIIQAIPSHWAHQVANLANACAANWSRLGAGVSRIDASCSSGIG